MNPTDPSRIVSRVPSRAARRAVVRAGAALAVLGGTAGLARAQAPVAGKDYRPVQPPVAVEASGRIEVVEFFWYGCPHCASLEAPLKDWVKKLPADVAFRKVHVPFREVRHQQLFYTLETLGLVDQFSDKVFTGIHAERQPLDSVDRITAYLGRHGLDAKKFAETWDSFSVKTRMRKASQTAEAYGVDGVPAFGVGGRWYTSPSMAGGNAQGLRVLDALIDLERRAGRK